jgi:phage shock protein C
MAKKLYRSRKDRVLVGVCGGVGNYFNVDPVLIRLAWVLASLACGAGILVYVIAAVLMPEKPEDYSQKTYEPKTEETANPVTQDQETPAVNPAGAEDSNTDGGEK